MAIEHAPAPPGPPARLRRPPPAVLVGVSPDDAEFALAVAAVSGPGSTIMLVLELRAPARAAIDRAMALARERGAALEVIAVVLGGWRRWEDRATVLARFALAIDGIAAGQVRHVEVQRGTLQSVAIEAGRERRPDLVVIGAAPGSGRAATAISEALGVPVLVARDRWRAGPPGAAAGPTYLHGASPVPPIPVGPVLAERAPPGVATLPDTDGAARRARLQRIALAADAVVVASAVSTDAILEVARSRDADLVIVGHRRRSWLGRLFRGRLVEDVVARCRRSVLVLPTGR